MRQARETASLLSRSLGDPSEHHHFIVAVYDARIEHADHLEVIA
jgi:hypothetical protein